VIKVALRGLAGRKLRAVLTGIAIVLGVAMISGTYILTDTVQSAFTNLFTDSYSGTDAVVTGRGLDISVDGEKPCAGSTVWRSPRGASSTTRARSSSTTRASP
jgi:putative ABC transport system permease protein